MDLALVVIGAAVLVAIEAEVPSRIRAWYDPTPIEQARERYANGEITLAQFEQVVQRQCPHTRKVREQLECINGVGPATSASIVDQFPTQAAIEAATADELESVHGVGPETAAAIRDQF